MDPSIRLIEFDSAAESLLSSSHLPSSDLHTASNVLLFGHVSSNRLFGMVGLEMLGATALLRSLAVTESNRGTGLGARLVSCAEQHAAALGAHTIYLLTNTAAKFFERHGYVHASRSEAPLAIASTSQFSELCPASSAFMSKQLVC